MNIVLHVEGMSCGHCVSAITTAVRALPEVTSVDVDLTAGTVTVGGGPDADAVAAAIEDCGYDIAYAA
ncbi:cation transporter [Mycobacterium sp. BMJ-28]